MVTHISEVGITKCSELQRTLDLEKEADARDRLDYLVSRGAVQGFIDDQGTFVTFDETMLQTLAATINETGRISTSALADLMHTLAMTSQSVRIKSTSAGHDVDEHSACAADHFTHDATTTPSADRHSAHTREES
ncbi:hypothetical protein SARC_00989 [Sphaeroforma arctica JP610]|uniref:Uncharacterized protein n=1 Tax=Sphaeroforma arctica JP610 TaxID=667725 RepID=A0A0L0GDA9_9EUKA|nr:hypothetical protein SARC_00989 [Sphaeroforma arctica JP610]KNC86894.1 hypothetical protein SARC_00989 [Sphaeroforma arctica JP610]|eukprot:XP_014160796.1 hypothetical protein SARC_00989 [Sphaeroforma arctica JP610]